MPGKYSVSVGAVAVGTDKGILNGVGGTDVRQRLSEIIIGSDDTPGDQATRFAVKRTTADGTGGGTPPENPLDPADPAARVDFSSGAYSTTEPTDTASSELLLVSLNQRMTYRWVAAPGYQMVAPATANNGLFLLAVNSTGTYGVEATILWEE